MARFLWPTLIVIAVTLAVVVSAAGEETRVELEYLDEMRTQATELARSGSMIRDIMSRVADVDREEFTTALDSVIADIDVALAFVADEPPTESLIPVWALYRQSIQSWSDGVSGLSVAILQAADDPQENAAINATGDALAELRAGDIVYQNLRSEFERDEVPEPVGPLAHVRMSPAETDLYSQSISYVAAARRSTNGLGLRPGLRVSQVVADPQWEINVDRQAVVPASETITFSTVITNSGNVASEPESVQMTLQGGAEPVVAVVEVPPLQPNGQTTVEFPAVDVVPEAPYSIRVELVLTNPDTDASDNMRQVDFTVNAS